MKYFAIFSLLLVISLALAFNLREPGNATLQRKSFLPVIPGMEKKQAGSYSRIISGKDAPHREFPYMVGLEFINAVTEFDKFCGGSLIDHEWVLTAAHCTTDAGFVKVFLGMRSLGHPALDYWIPSNHIVPHKDFVRNILTSDIALIRIPHVDFTSEIHSISLPLNVHPFPNYVNKTAVAMGWGYTSRIGTRLGNVLQYTNLTIISNEDCEKTYGKNAVYAGKICTSGYSEGALCTGDSGGPLISRLTNTLIGIASHNHKLGCALGYPDSFTRVDHYLRWIHENTGIPLRIHL